MTGGLKVRVRGGCGSPDTKREGALSKRRSSPVLVQNGVPPRAQRDWAAGAWLDAASWPGAPSCTSGWHVPSSVGCRHLWGQGRSLDWGGQAWALSLTCCVVSG